MSKSSFSPGTAAPKSGIYREVGPRGGKKREIVMVEGRPFPPAETPGSKYALIRATRH